MRKNSGKAYVIKGFSDQCPESYKYKLMAMGFTLGSIFKLVRLAPMGDPWLIEIKGSMISLRKSELAWIIFEENNE